MHDHTELYNKTVSCSIGEPWDFSSSDGKNILYARIVSIEKSDRNVIFLRNISEFKHEEKSVTWLMARRRHKEDDERYIERLAEGSSIEVNLYYFPALGDEIHPISTLQSDKIEKHWLIGSMKLLENQK